MGLRVEGLGLRVQGFGVRVELWEFLVEVLGFEVRNLLVWVQDCGVLGFGVPVSGVVVLTLYGSSVGPQCVI